jgi:hypothetical protein
MEHDVRCKTQAAHKVGPGRPCSMRSWPRRPDDSSLRWLIAARAPRARRARPGYQPARLPDTR